MSIWGKRIDAAVTTNHEVQAAPGTPAQAYTGEGRRFVSTIRSTRVTWIIGGLLTVGMLIGCSAIEDSTSDQPTTAEDYSCADLAEEAVNIGENNLGVALLKVRNPEMTQDHRSDYIVPTGDGETVVLQCRGAGVFNSGETADVKIELTVDSDEDAWVSWKPVG